MTTDFRTLLENLVEEVLDANQYKPPGVQRAIDRALAALAEPEPKGPTDEEIMELMPQQMREDLAAAARAITDQANTYDTRAKGIMRIILNRHCVDHARAVLARWGRPS